MVTFCRRPTLVVGPTAASTCLATCCGVGTAGVNVALPPCGAR